MNKASSPNYFYITTTLPYINAQPHIGFGLEIVSADVLARWNKLKGKDVFFNTGTDEHGQKIFEEAVKNKQSAQDYVDLWAQKFFSLQQQLDIIQDINFTRTSNPSHIRAAQKFWQLCHKNGDIYKAKQRICYCVGCELEKQDSELENGKCPLHPQKKLIERFEENYFFRFSKYQDKLLDLYNQKIFVYPESKNKEIKSFVKSGLKDFSISRLKEKMPWGITVPGDNQHVMYVWFDALINYISALGWPDEDRKDYQSINYQKYWLSGAIQLAGKDNLRQQAAMWQAMLMSAGLKCSEKILINGFISVNGQKMSKSLGNVISPEQMQERYGTQATRFLLLNLGPFGEDMDVSWEKFDISYQSILANNIGNTCSRIAALSLQTQMDHKNYQLEDWQKDLLQKITVHLDNFEITPALSLLIAYFSEIEKKLSIIQPWKLDPEKKADIMPVFVNYIKAIVPILSVFMPQIAEKLELYFNNLRLQKTSTKLQTLFPRIQSS